MKRKSADRRHCSAANITHLLVLLVLFTAMQISSGQTRVSRALADVCVSVTGAACVCLQDIGFGGRSRVSHHTHSATLNIPSTLGNPFPSRLTLEALIKYLA